MLLLWQADEDGDEEGVEEGDDDEEGFVVGDGYLSDDEGLMRDDDEPLGEPGKWGVGGGQWARPRYLADKRRKGDMKEPAAACVVAF